MQNPAQAYGKVAKQTARPRELEASLLLRAAARLQAIRDSWDHKQGDLDAALLFNRKLWSIFLTAVTSPDHPLPRETRQSVANLGLFVMKHTMTFTSDPRPDRLVPLISINRELAAGLMARA